MSLSLLTVVVDCEDPQRVADFWAKAFGSEVTQRNEDELRVRDAPDGASMYFMKVPEPKVGKNRLHVDVVTEGPIEPEIERLRANGARLVEVRQDPDTLDNPDRFAVMEDPEGNVFCVTSHLTLSGW